MNYKTLLFSILFFGILSCDKKEETCSDCEDQEDYEECEGTLLATKSLESEYDCTNTKREMEIDLSEDYTIIINQSDFDSLVTGDCKPEINFSSYDLVIGKKGLTSGNTSIKYELIEDCENGSQNLTVTFHQTWTTEAPNLTYHALIPKLENEDQLSVEIIVLD